MPSTAKAPELSQLHLPSEAMHWSLCTEKSNPFCSAAPPHDAQTIEAAPPQLPKSYFSSEHMQHEINVEE